jgi:glycosyltransferase involved in cell wall biosynthesis
VNDTPALDAPRTLPLAPVASPGPAVVSPLDQQPPIRVVELELAEPMPDLLVTPSHDGLPYRQALVLVRLHREPLGLLPLHLPDAQLPAGELARVLWSRFHPQIARHLTADGEPPAQQVPVAGPARGVPPPCGWEHAFAPGQLSLVSVVVTTCDRPFQLLQTLHSLLAQTYPRFEIIVVDNRPSATFTRDAVRRRYGVDPRVRYVAEPRVGLSAARNAGLAHARGELVAFTDDDVTVDRHWLSSLAHVFLQDEDAACVTGLILPLELETPAQLWFEQFGGFGKGFQRRSFDLGRNRPPDMLFPYTPGRFGSGANTAFRTGVLRALGGFAVELGAGTPARGGEDLDAYLNVILRTGYRIVYEPRALLWHPHRLDLPGLSRQIHRYGLGLSAAVTKRLLTSREERREIIRRLPAGLAYALHPRSAKNTGKGPSYPARLTLLEVAGMLRGPIAYGLSRRWHEQRHHPPPPAASVEEDR